MKVKRHLTDKEIVALRLLLRGYKEDKIKRVLKMYI